MQRGEAAQVVGGHQQEATNSVLKSKPEAPAGWVSRGSGDGSAAASAAAADPGRDPNASRSPEERDATCGERLGEPQELSVDAVGPVGSHHWRRTADLLEVPHHER